jgi:hypothetical protein
MLNVSHCELIYFERHSHEELFTFLIVELLRLNDIRSMLEEVSSNIRNNPRSVQAGKREHVLIILIHD